MWQFRMTLIRPKFSYIYQNLEFFGNLANSILIICENCRKVIYIIKKKLMSCSDNYKRNTRTQ